MTMTQASQVRAMRWAGYYTVAGLLFVLPLWLLTMWSPIVCAILSGLLWLGIWLYTVAVRRGRLRYAVKPDKQWQLFVTPQPGSCWVPAHYFDRLRPHLTEVRNHGIYEDEIHLVCRRHRIALIRQIWIPVLVAVGLFIAALAALFIGPVVGMPWWLLSILMLLAVGVAFVMSWRWRFSFIMVTNMRVLLVTAPPPWLLPFPGICASVNSLRLRAIHNADEHTDGFFQTLLGYGHVGIDAPGEGDREFNYIRFVGRARDVSDIINDAVTSARHG